ncbi:hypothetical protein BN1221_01460c [Brenneria goodwinii]|uniref:Uncharacterized protein n=1 Tax=Brenneria goodwinii TaxID=1109412 RepID=A0A0G4JTN7_9GAMM|nr:hypothetical protein BN1221_01460c [Brenneria goodwinii]
MKYVWLITPYYLYPSSFKLHRRWLPLLTRITYLSKLIGIHSVAALMQLEIYWV